MKTPMPVPVQVWQPSTVEEAWEIKEKFGSDAKFIAGGTLMQMQREQGIPFPPHLISLERIKELKGVSETNNGMIRIGALTTLEECRNNPILKEKDGLLSQAAEAIASPAVRNRGTIGGNILYGLGDALPALAALDAQLFIYTAGGFQTKRIGELLCNDSFSADSMILTHIQIPRIDDSLNTVCFFRKIGRREAFVPAVVTVALLARLNQDQKVESICLAVSSGIKRPQRLTGCENWLKGETAGEATLRMLAEQIKKEFKAPDDAFASSNYRKLIAANLLVSALEPKL